MKARPYSPPQWSRLQAQRTQAEIDHTVPPLWVGTPPEPSEGQRGLVLAAIAALIWLIAVVALVAWGLGGLR
jgi:hypothetical protein